jgi:hypothetical protein
MDQSKAEKAVASEEPFALADAASADELARLKASEELFELRYQRKRRGSRVQVALQSMVGLVAVLGFFANAFQTYLNKRSQEKQQQIDGDRWSREFDRASRADKYRAFFETSALVTDESNPSKRLVGYALLKEFVQDVDYNDKATVLLEEALTQELRRDNVAHGLSEGGQAAVTRILDALSHTSDCRALQQAAKSVDFVPKRKMQSGDVEEAQQVFAVYVRRLLGRAALSCPTFDDFDQVRRPLRQVLQRNPEMGFAKGNLDGAQANTALALMLYASCVDEVAGGSNGDCAEVMERYGSLCHQLAAGPVAKPASPDAGGHSGSKSAVRADRVPEWPEEQAACDVIARPLPVGPVDAGAPDAGGSGDGTDTP